jgi:hypothetical protein
MKDSKCIIQQAPNVVDDGYKINVIANAGFKVLSPHLTCIPKSGLFNLCKTILIAVFLLSLFSPAYAETDIREGYDENTEMIIKGTVAEITKGSRGPVILRLISGDRIFNVVTAPPWYLNREGITFQAGAELEITGSKYFGRDGSLYIIGKRIKNPQTGSVIILRDKLCRPLWKGHRMPHRQLP